MVNVQQLLDLISMDPDDTEPPLPVLLLSKPGCHIPPQVREEFMTLVEFKNFPASPRELGELISSHTCVIYLDTLSPKEKRMVPVDCEGKSFWVYSELAGSLIRFDPFDGVRILAPQG